MIVSAGTPYQSPVTPARRREEPKATPSERTEPADPTDDKSRTESTTGAQFAALMALLGGAGAKVRADLLKQVPQADSSLLEKLLAVTEGESAATSGRTTAPATPAITATSAADATRYGMLLGNTTAAGTPGAPAMATPAAESRIPADTLARIAGRHSASVEDLLALGEADAAHLKTKLNALLATAGTSDATAIAAANALAAALAASAANPTLPITSPDGLDPDFRARLEKVMARMKQTFGSEVTVVETVRSQERQNALYAQGRTTSGDTVTWKTDSMHTSGKAADVIVDKSWNNPAGFARLQQIAKEEGLRTLGAIDPGHLELERGASATLGVAMPAPQMNGIAQVASVANIAPVGTVRSISEKPAVPASTAGLGTTAPITRTTSDARATSNDASGDKPRRDRSAEAARPTNIGATVDNSLALNELAKPAAHAPVGPVESGSRLLGASETSAADAAERVQNISDMREQPTAVSQIKLEVDGPNGDTQHITVDMRGNTVGTNITTDATSADRMRARIGDLQTSLEGHGLQVDSVRISAPRPVDTADAVKQASAGERDAMRLAGAAGTGANDGNLPQGQRERSSATRDWEDRQAARDDQRRSTRQQQDRQRPEYQEKQ
jgi:hypothetical protein